MAAASLSLGNLRVWLLQLAKVAGCIGSSNLRGWAGATRVSLLPHFFVRRQHFARRLMCSFRCDVCVAPSPPGWSFFFARDLDKISPAGRSSMAAQRDFYLSALASAYDLRAWHLAVLLSIALACSFGCGPSNVLCKRFEAF